MKHAAQPIQILLIEDHQADARIVRETLNGIPSARFQVTHVERVGAAFQPLQAQRFDVVLLDLSLPDGHGLELIQRVVAVAPQVPILVLTGMEDEDLGVQAVQNGAQDYLVKGHIDGTLLTRAVRYAMERHRGEGERRRLLEERAELLASEHQSRLRAEAAVRARDEVLAFVAHKLRSPLNTITINASLLLATPLPPEQRDHQYQGIKRAVDRMDLLIRGLLDVVKSEAHPLSLERSNQQVARLVSDVFDAFRTRADEKRVELLSEIAGSAREVDVDRSRLQQVFSSLVDNAIRFTPPGGRITVRAEHVESAVRFSVVDTGVGIAPEDLDQLFDPVWQARMADRDGVGDGLVITKQIVKAHGGKIWVESQEGVGSTFVFTIPAATALKKAS